MFVLIDSMHDALGLPYFLQQLSLPPLNQQMRLLYSFEDIVSLLVYHSCLPTAAQVMDGRIDAGCDW